MHRCFTFEPEPAAARARAAAVDPTAYARERNHLAGAVTGLSPYLTHGLLSLPDALAAVAARHPLGLQHPLVKEFGWRAYFQHAWAQRGDAIFASLHAGPLPDSAYDRAVPADVREARTGVPVIDHAVRQLYAEGYLHNHARLWLASYLVHLRKLHWRSGADWLYGHLLDGDLASNHLSWQWVAGTGSSKPYLFNADNVARFAPACWHSPGSVVDQPYEALDALARSSRRPDDKPLPGGTAEPACSGQPPATLAATPPDPAQVAGRDVWLVHPWALGEPPGDLAPGSLRLGVLVDDFHQAWPWSAARWQFVGRRMAALAPLRWQGRCDHLAGALRSARSVRSLANPHLRDQLLRLVSAPAQLAEAPALFPEVDQPCASFSAWWQRSTRGLRDLAELPGLVPQAASARRSAP